jgi:hypothetical protein
MNRKQKLRKAFNIKRNNLSRRTAHIAGRMFMRDQGLAFKTITAKNAGEFIGFMKQYND